MYNSPRSCPAKDRRHGPGAATKWGQWAVNNLVESMQGANIMVWRECDQVALLVQHGLVRHSDIFMCWRA
jgi:hypothetical protein